MSLDQAINSTLLMDPTLRAGFEAINQAAGDHLTTTLRPNPELEISQTLLPLTRPFTEERQGGPPQLDLIVSYPIDWWLFGKRAAAMQAALQGVHASQAEYADLVRRRVRDTAVAYYDVVEAQALLELAEQDVENLQRVEEMTRVAVENGARPQVELNRIRLDRLNSQQRLREARQELTSAQSALSAAMGVGSTVPTFGVTGALAAPRQAELPSPAVAFALAQEQRPDIQALRWRVQQSRANSDLQEREAYPEVSSQLGYTRQFQEKAIGFPDAHSWGVGLSIGLPISDRNQGNRLRAQSEWNQAFHQFRAGLVELEAEIVALVAELETTRTNADATADEQLRLAEQVRDSIRQAYDSGGRPLIDVLDAQRNYRDTFRNYISSRADYWRAQYRFEAAIGQKIERP